MKWETYKTKGIKEKYVYRYLTIEKLIDFLESNSLFFSRLDKFEDNLENISPFDINELRFRIIEKPNDYNPEITEVEWDRIIENDLSQLKKIQTRLQVQQKHRFVSCWMLNDVESFGMWDIYGKSGFVLKFERKYFQKLIKESINLQEKPTNQFELLVAGKVRYQNFDEMLDKEKESLLKYSVFRKHKAFNHESEYRIIGFSRTIKDRSGVRYKLPKLETLDFEIIANPKLDKFQFEKYKSIISKYSKKHILKESSLKVWLDFRNNKY